jgi:hypothetical protein
VNNKRKDEKTDYKDAAIDTGPPIRRLKDIVHVTILNSGDADLCAFLVSHVLPEYQEDPVEAWAGKIACRGVKQNSSHWESRTLQEMSVGYLR